MARLNLDSLLRNAGEWLLDGKDYRMYHEGSLPGAEGFGQQTSLLVVRPRNKKVMSSSRISGAACSSSLVAEQYTPSVYAPSLFFAHTIERRAQRGPLLPRGAAEWQRDNEL